MKLSYRGVPYATESLKLEINEGEIVGKYRGQNWRYHYPRHIPQLKPKIYMQYRGVAYSTCPLPKTAITQLLVQEITEKTCPLPIIKRCKEQENSAQIHWDNIRRNLERRLEVAKAKGDEHLIQMLEQESKQLSLNFN
ncbi:MAG: DUF4278 domain-containing protein [Gomphosphaeria aponina SAG 52.96 = DSM 107014]|uniref:DUF4278 domain-containing protein n=1 Tax=Gomphosphaeria aponina SAG 52.96 = DSM 107014 TaxID=1521640 RepID=A0A941GW39_9CHRO|nr:DUF4278 domain-containing protein [Gomphosphaeria aponina SAG 52.96 = DSM 107014]